MLPSEVVDQVYAQFTKQPVLDPVSGTYVVDCDTHPPTMGITIGGSTFFLLSDDMIYHNGDGSCQSSLLPGTPEDGVVFFTLAGPFLSNVVSVYDFGNNEMRFAARTDGGGSSVANGSITVFPTPHPTIPFAQSSSGALDRGGIELVLAITVVVGLMAVL